MLHPQLDELIRRIRRNGMMAGLITNGFLLSEKRIEGLNDYNKAVSGVKPGDAALLFVNRGGKKFYVTVRAD